MPHQTSRRAEIVKLLALREREGLTYQELSDRCGLAAATLSWWSWRLRREVPEQATGFTELEVVDRVPSSDSSDVLRVCLADFVVEVPRDFDADVLGRVLDVVRSRC